MKIAAIINSGIVSNVIVVEDGEKGETTLTQLNAVEITDLDVRIGDLYDGKTFTRVKTEQEIEAEKAYVELVARRKAIADRLGLSEEDISDLFGI